MTQTHAQGQKNREIAEKGSGGTYDGAPLSSQSLVPLLDIVEAEAEMGELWRPHLLRTIFPGLRVQQRLEVGCMATEVATMMIEKYWAAHDPLVMPRYAERVTFRYEDESRDLTNVRSVRHQAKHSRKFKETYPYIDVDFGAST
jgi:hypothetical protein